MSHVVIILLRGYCYCMLANEILWSKMSYLRYEELQSRPYYKWLCYAVSYYICATCLVHANVTPLLVRIFVRIKLKCSAVTCVVIREVERSEKSFCVRTWAELLLPSLVSCCFNTTAALVSRCCCCFNTTAATHRIEALNWLYVQIITSLFHLKTIKWDHLSIFCYNDIYFEHSISCTGPLIRP